MLGTAAPAVQRIEAPQPVSQPAKLPSRILASVFLCALCGETIQPGGEKIAASFGSPDFSGKFQVAPATLNLGL